MSAPGGERIQPVAPAILNRLNKAICAIKRYEGMNPATRSIYLPRINLKCTHCDSET